MQPETPTTHTTSYQPVSPVKPSKPKKGKKVLLVLLVLLMVAGAALAGWWYGTDQATTIADQEIANLTKQVSDLEAKNDELMDEESELNDDLLVIKEWNVTLEPISGMSYEIEKVSDEEVLKLTTKEVAKLGGTCDEDTYLAIVSRSKTDPTDEESFQGKSIGKIGTYYYSVAGSNGTCSENPNELTIRNNLIAAAETIEAN